MGERILARSPNLGERLLEWRDPLGSAVEWIVEHSEGTDILFRWDGKVGENAHLYPGTSFPCSSYSDTPDAWRIDLAPLESAVHRLRRDWDEGLFSLWLEECRRWSPQFPWTVDCWKESFHASATPWLSGYWTRPLEISLQLAPFVQSFSAPQGIRALGFGTVGKKLSSLVFKELQSDLKSAVQGRVSMRSTLWASRCQPWLSTDDLYTFWRVPGCEEHSFLTSLQLWQPGISKKLRTAVRRRPEFGGWRSELAVFCGVTDPLMEGNILISKQLDIPREPFSWSESLIQRFQRRHRNWSTRLPYDCEEVQNWGKILDNCLQHNPHTMLNPKREVLVGLFHRGDLVALGQWTTSGRLTQWKGPKNAPITPELRRHFLELLPGVRTTKAVEVNLLV